MKRILINDGIHPTGQKMLEEAGIEVITDKIPQEDLINQLNNFDGICVRSATKVRKDLIDACPNLKVIARGGVGLDNIDVEYARNAGREVYNTPAASSRSVAELAMAHMMSLARFLHKSNRNMPVDGDSEFGTLKKSFSKGMVLEGKTLGIIGFGRIGQELAKIGMGLGMKIVAVDSFIDHAELVVDYAGQTLTIRQETIPIDELLPQADFISLHLPFTGKPVLGSEEFSKMKEGVFLINAARGGTVDEDAMMAALDSGKIIAAGLDVFENEPTPRKDILHHPNISLSPHIGASTLEAQENIGIELAEKIIAYFNK